MNRPLLLTLPGFFCLLFIVLLTGNAGYAQETDAAAIPRILSLEQAVQQARDHSIWALSADTRREAQYWAWRTYRAQYMPSLYLASNLPDFTRSNEAVQQPDGSYEFRPVSQNLSSVNLYAEQELGFSNTTVFLNSGLQRYDNFQTDEIS